MRVFLSGGTGLIGQAIVSELLERGDTALVLSRDLAKAKRLWPQGVTIVEGDPCYAGDWQEALRGCDAAVNLAGEPLDAKRWDARFRQHIHDSRIDSTRFMVEAITKLEPEQRPRVLVSASGVDYYGFAEIDLFDEDEVGEDAPGGESFLAGLCWDWEDETKLCSEAGVRVVVMRTGLVLSTRGALARLLLPLKLGFSGRMGSGKQWMSWVHIEDVGRAYLHALDSEIAGPVNLAAPGNLRNRDFAAQLGKTIGRRGFLPIPAFAMRLAVGQLSEYILKGRRTAPTALVESGFQFRFPELEQALQQLLRR